MFTKKEIITTIVFIIFFALLILFLPTLEGKIFNRKNYEYEESEEKKKEVEKYICTFSSNSNIVKSIIEATFYIDANKVTRIYTKESKTYLNKNSYDEAIKTIEKNVETPDLEIKTTIDNINNTIITVRGENIKEDTKVNYPINYNELTTYLDKNNYTCTIRYKK